MARGMISVTKCPDIFVLFLSGITPSFCVVYVLPHFENEGVIFDLNKTKK